jgi:AcrR family transcriptional regulator
MATQELTDTRERVLASAGQVFAAKGFKDATVREICQRAGVNIAAINYHFGDKERLYIESVKQAHLQRAQQVPLPLWKSNTPPEQKLLGFVRTLLERILVPRETEWHAHLMLREMAQPTAACAELVRDYIRPHFELLLGILDELLPADVSIERRHLIAFSVIGQCIYYRVADPVISLLVASEEYDNLRPDSLAQHITRLTLAALGRSPSFSEPGA